LFCRRARSASLLEPLSSGCGFLRDVLANRTPDNPGDISGAMEEFGHVAHGVFAAVPAAAHASPRLGRGVLGVDRGGGAAAATAEPALVAQNRRVAVAQREGLYFGADADEWASE
jgi:hypothetical protein